MDFAEIGMIEQLTRALNNAANAVERHAQTTSPVTPKHLASLETNLNEIAGRLHATNVILLTLGRFGLPSQNVNAFFEELRGSLFNLDPSLSDNIDHLKNS